MTMNTATADVLTRRDGQLKDIARNLTVASGVLADRRGELSTTLANLPATIHQTRQGHTGQRSSIRC